VVCASPAYLKRKGTPKTPKDLANHNCLQFSGLSPTPYWEFFEGGKARQVRVQGTLSATHGAVVIDAARGGLGIVRALSYQLQEAVAAGELRVLLQHFEAPPIPVSVVLPTGRMLPARVRALADLLQESAKTKDFRKLSAAKQDSPRHPPRDEDPAPPARPAGRSRGPPRQSSPGDGR